MQREDFCPAKTADCLTVHPALVLRPRSFSEQVGVNQSENENDIPIGNMPAKGRYTRNGRAQIKKCNLNFMHPVVYATHNDRNKTHAVEWHTQKKKKPVRQYTQYETTWHLPAKLHYQQPLILKM